ncbi:MAG: ABC transporter substrate-binding protein [Thiolinea sp.]
MADLKQLERDLKSGRLSRRDFMKLAAVFGFSAAAPGILSGTARAATPKAGGHFKLALGHGSTSDTLDPAKYENLYTQVVGKSIHNYLTEVRADGTLGPEIAESWEATPDAKTWTFQLRKGVEFHNGKPLTAQDVVASLNYHAGEDSQSAAKVIVDPMADIKADGDHVLVITLKDGNADLPYQLSDYHLAIMPANDDGKITMEIAQSGVGCGSYQLKNYDAGVNTELEKFAKHWNDQVGHFASAEILSVKDVAARTNSLRTGEVDAIDRLDIKTLHLLERDKNVRIMETSGNAHYSMPMRCDTDPYKNNDVRLALKYAINREEMLETLLRGHGYVGNDHPIGRANRFPGQGYGTAYLRS